MATQPAQYGKEVVPADGLNIAYDKSNEKYFLAAQPEAETQPPESRICGRRKTTFWLLIALAATFAIVIAVAVVAGVLGSGNKTQEKCK